MHGEGASVLSYYYMGVTCLKYLGWTAIVMAQHNSSRDEAP